MLAMNYREKKCVLNISFKCLRLSSSRSLTLVIHKVTSPPTIRMPPGAVPAVWKMQRDVTKENVIKVNVVVKKARLRYAGIQPDSKLKYRSSVCAESSHETPSNSMRRKEMCHPWLKTGIYLHDLASVRVQAGIRFDATHGRHPSRFLHFLMANISSVTVEVAVFLLIDLYPHLFRP